MGVLWGRAVYNFDTTAWVRSGLLTLSADPRIHFADDKEPAPDLTFDVELVKAYINADSMAKTTNVVLRVRWQGADSSVYRADQTGLSWGNSEGEAHAAFTAALASLMDDVHRDVMTRCAAKPSFHQ